jgi:hypothetical protein
MLELQAGLLEFDMRMQSELSRLALLDAGEPPARPKPEKVGTQFPLEPWVH